jgi:hypothetical protein
MCQGTLDACMREICALTPLFLYPVKEFDFTGFKRILGSDNG